MAEIEIYDTICGNYFRLEKEDFLYRLTHLNDFIKSCKERGQKIIPVYFYCQELGLVHRPIKSFYTGWEPNDDLYFFYEKTIVNSKDVYNIKCSVSPEVLLDEKAQPLTKSGKWLDIEPAPFDQIYETCSECGVRQTVDKGKDNFCGVCGADMRGEEKDG